MEIVINRVIWSGKAKKALKDIFNYVKTDNLVIARNYLRKIINFGKSLDFFPLKYPLCRKISFRKREYHCAPFDEYVIVYKINNDELLIVNVIHSKRLV